MLVQYYGNRTIRIFQDLRVDYFMTLHTQFSSNDNNKFLLSKQANQDINNSSESITEITDHILIVEDDADIALITQRYLEMADYKVVIASDGQEALEHLDKHKPQLVVLDWMLPKLDGIDLLKHIRDYSNQSSLPVIMVTAKHEEENRILGLELGADDYLSKPFSPRELLARVKAVLRRSTGFKQATEAMDSFQRGPLDIQPEFRRVLYNAKEIEMTSLEFDLLVTLAKEPGRVYKRDVLLDTVWGSDYIGIDRVVDVHVYNLRKKLASIDESCAAMIKTVWRIGYKFQLDILKDTKEDV